MNLSKVFMTAEPARLQKQIIYTGGKSLKKDAAITAIVDVISESLRKGEKVQLLGLPNCAIKPLFLEIGIRGRNSAHIRPILSSHFAFEDHSTQFRSLLHKHEILGYNLICTPIYSNDCKADILFTSYYEYWRFSLTAFSVT